MPMLSYYTMLFISHLTRFLCKVLEIPMLIVIHLLTHSFIYSIVAIEHYLVFSTISDLVFRNTKSQIFCCILFPIP